MTMMNDRFCPICGDPIPATAHRLKKLCGKKTCMMEQQRISGRKSYHKVLGHTEPEKRSCIVCGDDISNLRTNRRVCTKPTCKEVIVKRSKNDYYERNLGNPLVKEQRNLNQANYRARKAKPRNCQICHDDISHLERGRTICYKQSCIDYRERLRAQKGKTYQRTYRVVHSKPVRERVVREPKPPKINNNYQRKPVAASKQFGIARKKPITMRPLIPEDDVPWTPKPMNLPESFPVGTSNNQREESVFEDPWNCHACRMNNGLCTLHYEMDMDGYTPRKAMI